MADSRSQWNSAGLSRRGFVGFRTASELQASRAHELPQESGVYIVFRPASASPTILPTSPAGHFRGKDPTIERQILESRWVAGAKVVYIGRARGTANRSDLRRRANLFLKFGAGAPVAHWGGRAIWQLERSWDLTFCWRTAPAVVAEALEAEMLREFEHEFEKLPFANLRRQRRHASADH